jgi:hypothetical protein
VVLKNTYQKEHLIGNINEFFSLGNYFPILLYSTQTDLAGLPHIGVRPRRGTARPLSRDGSTLTDEYWIWRKEAMTTPFAEGLKKLLWVGAHDFLPFVRPDLHIDAPLPTEPDDLHAGGLLRCRDAQGRVQLVHFEFQRDNDLYIGERLLAYMMRASRKNDHLPVTSCVIHLNNIQTIPQPPLIVRLPDGTVTIKFHYVSIQLGQIPGRELLALDRQTPVPLLPFTEGGNTIEQVERMIEKLFSEKQADLLWIGLSLAESVFTEDQDLEWLRRRREMLNDFLANAPMYQDVLAQSLGRAEGEAI